MSYVPYYFNPWETDEPHFKPGYTGYTPQERFHYAKTYGHLTHQLLSAHPVAGDRLAPVLDDEEGRLHALDVETTVSRREASQLPDQLRLRGDIKTGYTGYIPRNMWILGKCYRPMCREAITEFEKFQDIHRSDREPLVLPPQEILPVPPPLPRPRLHARKAFGSGPNKVQLPDYAHYSQSPYDMSDMNPRKLFMPGYTGYVSGKPFVDAIPYSAGTHHQLCDFTNSNLERQVIARRPSIHQWKRDSGISVSEKPRLDGYHHPLPPLDAGALTQYTGFVPGYRSAYGGRYGEVAKELHKQRQLADLK